LCKFQSVRDSGRYQVHIVRTPATPLHDHTECHTDENLISEIHGVQLKSGPLTKP